MLKNYIDIEKNVKKWGKSGNYFIFVQKVRLGL